MARVPSRVDTNLKEHHLPFCGCGCGQRVKRAGLHYASKECAHNARQKVKAAKSAHEDLVINNIVQFDTFIMMGDLEGAKQFAAENNLPDFLLKRLKPPR